MVVSFLGKMKRRTLIEPTTRIQVLAQLVQLVVFQMGLIRVKIMDMAGNVWEWTTTLWRKDLSKPDFTYPYSSKDGREDLAAGPEALRVLRGGSYLNDENNLRCAARYRGDPDGFYDNLGFRILVAPISLPNSAL